MEDGAGLACGVLRTLWLCHGAASLPAGALDLLSLFSCESQPPVGCLGVGVSITLQSETIQTFIQKPLRGKYDLR